MPGRIRDPGPGVKDTRLDERLRAEGSSTPTSARIADAAAGSSRAAGTRAGGRSADYEGWTVAELRRKAAEVGIDGRSSMRRSELVAALRRH